MGRTSEFLLVFRPGHMLALSPPGSPRRLLGFKEMQW